VAADVTRSNLMPASVRPRRSALYIPGSNERAMAKAATMPADVIVFDLEDSIPPGQKEAARDAVANAVAKMVGGRREIVVRINDLDTAWAPRDIAAMAAVRPDAILLPKIQRPDDIRRARAAFAAARNAKAQALWVMIETPAAVLNVAAIAAIAALPAPPITAFVVGTNDLAAELGVPARPGRPALMPHIAQTQLAARAHGLAVIDGTFNDIDDRKGLLAECRQGRDLGLDGKTVIHPTQIAVANEAFAPDPEELFWSRKVVEAFAEPENADAEVIRLSGRMVERLHERAARRMLAIADAIALIDEELRQRPKQLRRPAT
jgi:citrate lyase subunit beta/citryl-CoA lyase